MEHIGQKVQDFAANAVKSYTSMTRSTNHGDTSATTCYQEFGSNRVEDIQKLRSILGKRFYAVPYIGEEDGEEYYNMVLESPR